MRELEWLRLDAAGGDKTDDTPVFSSEVGEATKTVRRAWTLAILKAHGIAPKWRTGTYKDLAAESLQQRQAIDLHWHDLRHEYASRRARRPFGAGARPSGSRVHRHDRALRQPAAGSSASCGGAP